MNSNKLIMKIAITVLFMIPALPSQVHSATSLGTFSNYSAISIDNQYKATPYPSEISVTGITTRVDFIRIKLNKMNHTRPEDIGVLLVGPQEQAVVLMNGAGGETDLPADSNLVFDDIGNALTSDPIFSGTYRPTNLSNILFPDPAPSTYNNTLSTFTSSAVNGTWKLFVRDSWISEDNGNISGGWQIEFFSQSGTSIDIQPQDQTIFSGQTATLSVSAMSDDVLSYQWYQGVSGNTIKPVPGANSNSFTTSPLFGPMDYWVRIISSKNQTVDSSTAHITTIALKRSFSNGSAIMINDNDAASPYPATIDVYGLTGMIKKVRITLNDVNHDYPEDIGVLLVGPQGQKVVLMNGAGITGIINTNLVFDDSGSALTDPMTSGTYRPTNRYPSRTFPVGPNGEVLDGPYDAGLAVFNGIAPNGQWKIYVMDAQEEDSGSINGGWQIEFLTDSYSLKVVFNGNGNGFVRYLNSTINTDYETSIPTGEQVILESSSDQYSLFTGWAGISSCSSNANCQFNMAANTTATATFTLDELHSALVGSSNYYATIANAYDATPSSTTIKLWGINFPENLLLELNKVVTLKGGYNGTYGAQDPGAFTTITGNLKIKAGRVNVDKIIIK